MQAWSVLAQDPRRFICLSLCLTQLLYDTFSAFGVIVSTPKIMRDPETGNSRGFGFVSYDCFEVSGLDPLCQGS